MNLNMMAEKQANGSVSILTPVELTSHKDYNLSTQNVGITLFLHECGFQNCKLP